MWEIETIGGLGLSSLTQNKWEKGKGEEVSRVNIQFRSIDNQFNCTKTDGMSRKNSYIYIF